MRSKHFTIEKVENGYLIEDDSKTWIADSIYNVGEIVKEIAKLIDGKDDLNELDKAVEDLLAERKVDDGR